MEENIRNGPEGTKPGQAQSGPGMATRIQQRFSATAGVELDPPSRTEQPRAVPMSALLAADSGHDIDFEPERLGLTARTQQLSQ